MSENETSNEPTIMQIEYVMPSTKEQIQTMVIAAGISTAFGVMFLGACVGAEAAANKIRAMKVARRAKKDAQERLIHEN